MPLFRVIIGLAFCLLGYGYLFRPQMILRMNAFMRKNIFNDTHVLLSSRRVGSLFLIVGAVLLILSIGAS